MNKKLRIAFPRLPRSGGPNIFMRRLRDSFIRQDLVSPCSYLFPWYDIGLFTSKAKNYYGNPYILRVDGIYPGKSAANPEKKKVNEVIYRSLCEASGIIYQSYFSRHLVEVHFGEIPGKNRVIYNGTRLEPPGEKDNLRKKLGFPQDRRFLICSARWRTHKRLPEIIKTFQKLNAIEDRYSLIILGDAPDVLTHKHMYHMGTIPPETTSAYYQCADVYIHLAWLDHCPNTAVEAIANGIPVVCSNQGGTREIVEGARAGIVSECDADVDLKNVDYPIPSPDWDPLLHDILRIFEHYEAFQQRINREFVNIERVSQKYADFMQEVWTTTHDE